MKMYRAYKTELKPNNRQRTNLLQHAGAARFAYNWGLQIKIEEYEKTGKSPSAYTIHKELVEKKKKEFSWMYQVSKCAPQEALIDLDKAFRNFFRGLKNGTKIGFPKFKSKRSGVNSFRLYGSIRVFSSSVQLPRLGRIKIKERGYLPLESERVRIISATVSTRAGRWSISLSVEEDIDVPKNYGPIVGVDLGIKYMATVSDGTMIENPKALLRYERKLKRLQRSLSRKKIGSRNREKVRKQIQILYMRITNIRKDAIHKATSSLTKTKSVIGVEDLCVRGLVRGRFSKSVSDVGFGEFRRQLEYKSKWYGSKVVVINRFYPSSKTCSSCREVKNSLSLSVRTFFCEECGLRLDRDLNASLNIMKVAVEFTETLNACKSQEVQSLGLVPDNEAGMEPSH
jgi:putative transposase